MDAWKEAVVAGPHRPWTLSIRSLRISQKSRARSDVTGPLPWACRSGIRHGNRLGEQFSSHGRNAFGFEGEDVFDHGSGVLPSLPVPIRAQSARFKTCLCCVESTVNMGRETVVHVLGCHCPPFTSPQGKMACWTRKLCWHRKAPPPKSRKKSRGVVVVRGAA
jgi:hypothetical protein